MKVTGCILAGGQGSRMSGEDKGLISFQGRPLIAHVIDKLLPQVNEIIINANRNLEVYSSFGFPVVQDHQELYSGPLAGIERGLFTANSEKVVFVPCDSPFIPLNLVSRLLESMAQQHSQCAYVKTPEGSQPVFCALDRMLHEHLFNALKEGDKKLLHWLHKHPHSEVFFENAEEFINLNTPDDIQRWQT